MITSTGAKFWLRFCLSVLVLVIFKSPRTQENCVSAVGVTIVNHCALVKLLLRTINLLRRSIFSTAGSFGYSLGFFFDFDFENLPAPLQGTILQSS